MELNMYPNESIKIKSHGKYPQTIDLWISDDGFINHSHSKNIKDIQDNEE